MMLSSMLLKDVVHAGLDYLPVPWFAWMLWTLRHRPFLNWYLCVGVLLNDLLNRALKGYFRQPRPRTTPLDFHAHHLHFPHLLPYHHYGMPSGHAQFAGLITAFAWQTAPDEQPLWRNLAIGGVVLLQRWAFLQHDAAQVAVGYFVGWGVGLALAWLAKRALRGTWRPRNDDGCTVADPGTFH